MLSPEQIERVLVVTAHPDDVDFGAGGTVADFTSRGVKVSYCICTDGDAGGFDPAIPRSEIGGIRQREQRAAAAISGVSDVTFLGYPDGRLTPSIELRRDISRQVRRVKPQLVIAQSPERRWDRIGASHPDHLAAGEAAVCTVYPDAQNPFAHLELAAEGWEAWNVVELWLMATPQADHLVDVTAALETKLAALASHESQFPEGFSVVEARVRQWMSLAATEAGMPAGTFIESFQRVETG